MDFSLINYWALLVGTLGSFGIGALWYSPILFGKAWQRELGMTEEDLKGANMGKIFGTCLILTAIMALGMGMLIQGHPLGIDWYHGMKVGAFIGIFFVGTSTAINYLYQRKSIKLWAIDAGYQVFFITLQGTIFGAWH